MLLPLQSHLLSLLLWNYSLAAPTADELHLGVIRSLHFVRLLIASGRFHRVTLSRCVPLPPIAVYCILLRSVAMLSFDSLSSRYIN